jgi:hypothetical protein
MFFDFRKIIMTFTIYNTCNQNAQFLGYYQTKEACTKAVKICSAHSQLGCFALSIRLESAADEHIKALVEDLQKDFQLAVSAKEIRVVHLGCKNFFRGAFLLDLLGRSETGDGAADNSFLEMQLLEKEAELTKLCGSS